LLGAVEAPPEVEAVLPPSGDDPACCPCCGKGPMRPVRHLYPVPAPPVVRPYRCGSQADAA
jgi:hypothetical protein